MPRVQIEGNRIDQGEMWTSVTDSCLNSQKHARIHGGNVASFTAGRVSDSTCHSRSLVMPFEIIYRIHIVVDHGIPESRKKLLRSAALPTIADHCQPLPEITSNRCDHEGQIGQGNAYSGYAWSALAPTRSDGCIRAPSSTSIGSAPHGGLGP
ncbi:hypothetical protein BDV10DRAFT_174592 [Aspergillus recurvatus]